METTKKSIGFGFRGWMLIIYQFIGFMTWTVFTNFSMNVLADMYGGSTKVSTVYSISQVVAFIAVVVLVKAIAKLKSTMKLSVVLGIISMVFAVAISIVPPTMQALWLVALFLMGAIGNIWATLTIGIIVGQWFPRRKGTVMGIATFAFPVTNAFLGVFAGAVFKKGFPDPFSAFLPFLIVGAVGMLIGIIFVKDYPEQCGCYRDNDKSFTPEIAKAMMEKEIENKRTTVWTLGNSFKSRDFWFVAIPMGLLLLCAIGMMTQMVPMLMTYTAELAPIGGFTTVTLLVAVFACFGSWLLGVLDTKLGTKKAIIISVVLMIVSGVIGIFDNVVCAVIALLVLALYEGAASNFTVSAAAQYWRREDFASVFAGINPIASLLSAIGPMTCAILATKAGGYSGLYGFFLAMGIISLVLILLFSPKHLKTVDDKYRSAAGKPLDDELVGRK